MIQNCFTLFHCNSRLTFNPRTYTQTHTSTVGYEGRGGGLGGCVDGGGGGRGGGGGVDGPPPPPRPRVFDMLQYFETIYLYGKPLLFLNKMRYIL